MRFLVFGGDYKLKNIVFILFFFVFLVSCSSKENVESKWRVLNDEVYAPQIDETRLFSSLDELEKLIVAPISYFQEKGGIYSFVQNVNYEVSTETADGPRKLVLNENARYSGDKNGNFSMSYQNNKNEGWEIVWLNNFLYRKQFGGEFTKTFSMGEHVSLRDGLFGSLPSIYLIARENAVIRSEKEWKIGSFKGRLVTLAFSDKKEKRAELPKKKYLQNLQGTEEMKDDSLIAGFAKKNKKNIVGAMTLFVLHDGTVLDMEIDLSFDFADDGISFAVKGKRTLSSDFAAMVKEPEYNDEYHRRTLDSSVNIMKEKEDVKHDEK